MSKGKKITDGKPRIKESHPDHPDFPAFEGQVSMQARIMDCQEGLTNLAINCKTQAGGIVVGSYLIGIQTLISAANVYLDKLGEDGGS